MIDTTLDLRDDAGARDPDTYSPTLRRYHRLLWSKTLPDGRAFELEAPTRRGRYLYHSSEAGEFFLASDTVVPTFRSYAARGMPALIAEVPNAELDAFQRLNHTIGGMMVFPGDRRPGVGQTMNGARGFNPAISDRFDLTVECIRRHYEEPAGVNPLAATLRGYADFFALFGDFGGYVEFFLLEDLLDPDLRFFLPFDGFSRSALPQDVGEYRSYRDRACAFLERRNARIAAWSAEHLSDES